MSELDSIQLGGARISPPPPRQNWRKSELPYLSTMNKQKIITISFIAVLMIFIGTGVCSALEIDYPVVPGGAPVIGDDTTLPGYIHYIFNFSIIIGGILGFVIIIYGGVLWFMSAGSPAMIGEAKSKMTSGALGLILLLCCYLILTTINPELVIFREMGLQEFTPTEETELEEQETETTFYNEIPIGLLTERILAKDIDCYNYDNYGNKTSLMKMENHDRMDCIKKLNQAIQIKNEQFIILVYELRDLIKQGCKCSECNTGCCNTCSCTKTYSSDSGKIKTKTCRCCNIRCGCYGSPRAENNTECDNLTENRTGNPCKKYSPCLSSEYADCLRADPCKNRKAIDIQREVIKIFLNGEDDATDLNGNSIKHNTVNYFDDATKYFKDKLGFRYDKNTFLPLKEALSQLEEFRDDLNTDLRDIIVAERLTKTSYGQRISLAEFMKKKSERKIDKILFQDSESSEYFDISEYCRTFNCIQQIDGICSRYGLNGAGNLCNTYNLDGEPASFYFPAEQ